MSSLEWVLGAPPRSRSTIPILDLVAVTAGATAFVGALRATGAVLVEELRIPTSRSNPPEPNSPRRAG